MRFAALLLWCSLSAYAQPGPLEHFEFSVPAGTTSLPSITPFAMSFYPFHNGAPNDSIRYILAGQLVPGSAQSADRVIDTATGAYAYLTAPDVWNGSLNLMRYGRAFLFVNRHDARTITLEGYPADSMTYISPMPAGLFRTAAPRMSSNRAINGVGLSVSGFHWSQGMRQGGDIVIDMISRAIARRDSAEGWIGTLDSMRIGQPVIIQVNHPLTFDWTYTPGQE